MEDLEIHGKSKYCMFATIFRTKNVPEEWTTDYIPNATDEEFVKKNIFLAMDERSKLMADWKSVQPKLKLIPYQCVNGSKHQCNPREGATGVDLFGAEGRHSSNDGNHSTMCNVNWQDQ